MLQAPMIADVEVDLGKRVSASIRVYKSNEQNAKQAALYEAMKNSGCDAVVHPMYEITFGKKVIDVTVSALRLLSIALRQPSIDVAEV